MIGLADWFGNVEVVEVDSCANQDRATGNEIAMWQRTAHEARVETNNIMWPGWCNLDAEKGNCNIYI